MELRLSRLDLPLVHTFTIARGSESVANTVLFRIAHDGLEGLGESAPTDRYDQSVDSIIAYFEGRPFEGKDPFALERMLAGIPPAARCGLDIALHDLIGKRLDRPLWQLFGLDRDATPVTSFTIGIDAIETMLSKVEEVREHPILKIKLAADPVEMLSAIRSRYTGTIRVDANEAWTPEEAVTLLRELARYDVEFCEQPIPAGSPERLRYVRERSRIPIVADEDAVVPEDVPPLAGCVDGINVKLAKCGGIRAALAMIHTARACGLRIMLGCMVESAILATAAAHLSPLVDWADLDGPFLTAHDPFAGVTYDRGRLVLPADAGLGVREVAVA